jgi:hypothetical protein
MASQLSCAAGHQWQSGDSGKGAMSCPICGASPTLASLGAPPETAAALAHLQDQLGRAAGHNLAGLILYGGLARGRYHPRTSDINLVVLLRDTSGPALDQIAPALRHAWRAIGVEPLILQPNEVEHAAVDFPAKFLDIQSHHVVLTGDDPFAALEIDAGRLRAQVSQGLRNIGLRLRRQYVAMAHDPDAVALMLGKIARPLAIELSGLLRLKGKPVPAEDRTVAIFEAAAEAFNLDRATLRELAELRRAGNVASEPAELFTRLLTCISQVQKIV